jgi:hypothetical protein
MANEKAGFVLPPPPPNRQIKSHIAFAVVGLLASASSVVLGSWEGVAPMIALVAAAQWLLFRSRRMEVGSALAHAALDRAARGRFVEARALLDAVPSNVQTTHVGQMVFSQRAALALYEGKLEEAVAHATVAAREGKRLNAIERIHQGSALSIRAVAHAGLGNDANALADANAVRTAEYRQGVFVARAALSEAIVRARKGDLDGLALVLREERPLLFGATNPRERQIARALARMVAAKKGGVYREAAKRDDEELDAQASWIAKLAPEAARYAKPAKLGDALEAPEEVPAAGRAAAEKAGGRASSRSWKLTLVLWGVLLVLVVTIWQLLDPVGHGRSPEVNSDTSGGAFSSMFPLLVGVGVMLAGWFVFKLRQARRLTVELSKAMETRLRERLDEARDAFTKLTQSKALMVAPQAYRELATIATMTGDFRGAQKYAEAGIASATTSPMALALARPVLLPMLHAELAVAFAAENRVARAEEELEKIRVGFPGYPYLAKDTFRTRLLAAVSAQRLDEAAEMARSRPVDLPLSIDEELLCDLLRVRAGDRLPEGERERIEADVRDDLRAAAFLDRVAPALRTTALRTRVASAEENVPLHVDDLAQEAAEEHARRA